MSYTGGATLLGESLGQCEECPYGGSCSGNNIVPRANYWGYLKGQEVVFASQIRNVKKTISSGYLPFQLHLHM